jgi:hypothetical protein
MAGAPQYPQQGKISTKEFRKPSVEINILGYGVDKPQSAGKKK